MDRDYGGQSNHNDKEDNERLERTGQKLDAKDALVESKYSLHQNGKEDQDKGSKLDEIEAEIKKCAKRLEEIHHELKRETDQYSDRFLDLEHERSELKKRVIDLDYTHRVQFANSIRASRRRDTEDRERLLKQAETEKQRRKKEVDDRLVEDRKQRQRRRQQRDEEDESRKNQSHPSEEGEKRERRQDQHQIQTDKKGQEEQQKLERSRRQLRIAQIESELVQDRLRRSRRAALDAQLIYLRATYTYPYGSWRDSYPYSYPLYPYSAYPYSYPYTTYPLYPYSSPYLSPYSSLNPYRYRWI